jgi:hypothetical protein
VDQFILLSLVAHQNVVVFKTTENRKLEKVSSHEPNRKSDIRHLLKEEAELHIREVIQRGNLTVRADHKTCGSGDQRAPGAQKKELDFAIGYVKIEDGVRGFFLFEKVHLGMEETGRTKQKDKQDEEIRKSRAPS